MLLAISYLASRENTSQIFFYSTAHSVFTDPQMLTLPSAVYIFFPSILEQWSANPQGLLVFVKESLSFAKGEQHDRSDPLENGKWRWKCHTVNRLQLPVFQRCSLRLVAFISSQPPNEKLKPWERPSHRGAWMLHFKSVMEPPRSASWRLRLSTYFLFTRTQPLCHAVNVM